METVLKSPLGYVVEWYKKLPENIKPDVAYLIGTFTPGFEQVKKKLVGPESYSMSHAFTSILESSQKSTERELGMTICVRGAIDFFVIEQKKKNNWKRHQYELNFLAAREGSEQLSSQARELEFKAAQWKKACDDWYKIRKNELSDESITNYIERI